MKVARSEIIQALSKSWSLPRGQHSFQMPYLTYLDRAFPALVAWEAAKGASGASESTSGTSKSDALWYLATLQFEVFNSNGDPIEAQSQGGYVREVVKHADGPDEVVMERHAIGWEECVDHEGNDALAARFSCDMGGMRDLSALLSQLRSKPLRGELNVELCLCGGEEGRREWCGAVPDLIEDIQQLVDGCVEALSRLAPVTHLQVVVGPAFCEWIPGALCRHRGRQLNDVLLGYVDPALPWPVLTEEQIRAVARTLRVEAPPLGNPKPQRRKLAASETSVFDRDPHVVAYVLQVAAGRCEGCGSQTFVRQSDGSWYLEVHHVRPLEMGGPDTPDNCVALCPNCHAALHRAERGEKLKRIRKLYGQVERLEGEAYWDDHEP